MVGWVVGQFVLEEDSATVLAVPDHVIFLIMFDRGSSTPQTLEVSSRMGACMFKTQSANNKELWMLKHMKLKYKHLATASGRTQPKWLAGLCVAEPYLMLGSQLEQSISPSPP